MKQLQELAMDYAYEHFPSDNTKRVVAHHSFSDGFNEAVRVLTEISGTRQKEGRTTSIGSVGTRSDSDDLPWISVDDDLPCRHPEMCVRAVNGKEYTYVVFLTDGDNSIGYGMMTRTSGGQWSWIKFGFENSVSDSLYWMRCPRFPKKKEI